MDTNTNVKPPTNLYREIASELIRIPARRRNFRIRHASSISTPRHQYASNNCAQTRKIGTKLQMGNREQIKAIRSIRKASASRVCHPIS